MVELDTGFSEKARERAAAEAEREKIAKFIRREADFLWDCGNKVGGSALHDVARLLESKKHHE